MPVCDERAAATALRPCLGTHASRRNQDILAAGIHACLRAHAAKPKLADGREVLQ